MSEPALVVGVDGGNSKTDLVLADTEGRILTWIRGEGTRPHVDTMPVTAKQLGDLVRRALRTAGRADTDPVAVGAYFLANVDIPADERTALRELSRLGVATQTIVRNDVFAVLRAGAPEGWGVAVVSGAGINAAGVHPGGRAARFLALGDITGDWGGGHAVARAGLGAAVRAGDGRGPATSLRRVLPPHLGMRSVEEVALAVNSGRLPSAALHGLAPVVFAEAAAGDGAAREILVRLGDEIVTMVTALLRRLRLLRTQTPVVLGGGTLQHGRGFLVDHIRDRLADVAPYARPRVLDVAPVAGALAEALAAVGATDVAAQQARRSLVEAAGPVPE
jgi:N-acetylglucosamine kinase-like BadF-type ATPase